jgi:hypothetical protein
MISPEACAKFFKLIATRKIPEAEEELEKIQTKLDTSKGDLGYLRALEGLILTQKSGDKNIYLSRASLDENSVKEIRREFLAHASNELHEDYDRGYFQGLADYLKVVEDQKLWEQMSKPTEKKIEDELGKETNVPKS